MPPENSAQHESERFQKSAKTLIEKVDALESREVKNTPQDWSEEVKRAVEAGEERIRRKVEDLSPYLDDPEKFLAEKLKTYRKEIEEITRRLPRDTKDMDINNLTGNLFPQDQQPKKVELLENVAEAKKEAAEDPYFFILGFEQYSKIDGFGILLEQAVRNCVDNGEEAILFQFYEHLHGQTFFEGEVNRAFQKLKERESSKLFEFVTGMGSANRDFIKRPDVMELLPKVFEVSLFENPRSFYEGVYTLYEREPWFEETFRTSFERLCIKKPSDAFDLLVELKNKTEFFEKDYVKEHVPQLVQTITQGDKLSALYNCDVYQNFYTQQEWTDILVQTIKDLKKEDVKRLARGVETLKEKLPKEAMDLFMKNALLISPAELMKAHSDFQDFPNAKELFAEAAKNLRLLEPGTALRILDEDSGKELPFENRDDYIKGAASWAVNRNPTSAIEYFSVYEHLENAQSLLASAQKRSLIAQNLGRTPYPSPEASEAALFDDPALQTVGWIERTWLPSNLSDRDFAEAAAMISRNLYLAEPKLLPNEETCRTEYQRIMETREGYKDVPLFSGRNVILASHLEQWSEGGDRFGKKALTDNLQTQQGEGREFAHYEAKKNTAEALKKAKQAILEKVETIGHPMTFLFDGHGGPDALYLSDGQVEGLQPASAQDILETEKTIKITVDELSAALTKRSQKIGKEKVSKDILIFSACYNHTFLRSMYDKLEASGAGKPIVFGESEFGQVGYSSKESPYGSSFFDQLIQPGKPTTLGDIWNLPYNTEMNPSLYIPSNNTPQQVAANEIQGQESSVA